MLASDHPSENSLNVTTLDKREKFEVQKNILPKSFSPVQKKIWLQLKKGKKSSWWFQPI